MKQEKDLEMWQKWKANPNPANLQELMDTLKPLVRYESNRYAQTGITRTLLEAKAQEFTFEAIKTYNPAHSQLNTHVVNHLKRLNRYAIENQNVMRVQENKIFQYRKFMKAKDELTDQLGREPTEIELRSKLGVGFKLANMHIPKAEHMYSINTEAGGASPTRDDLSYESMSLKLLHNSLSGTQKEVMSHAFGIGKKRMERKGDIAKKLKISNPMVSKHLRAIEKKYKRYNQASNFLIGGGSVDG